MSLKTMSTYNGDHDDRTDHVATDVVDIRRLCGEVGILSHPEAGNAYTQRHCYACFNNISHTWDDHDRYLNAAI